MSTRSNKKKKYRTVPQQVRQNEDPVYKSKLFQALSERNMYHYLATVLLDELLRVYKGVLKEEQCRK